MDSQKLIKCMNNKDKIDLLSGADFWHTKAYPHLGLLSVRFADGPCGLRVQTEGSSVGNALPSTAYPSPACIASTFNKYLAFEVAAAIGTEARALGVDIVLAPGVNIKRSPLCGRNFEYFSEDPYLSGEMGAKFIAGLRSRGVGACLKHFACYNREEGRHVCDSIVDERALREIYLAAFERALAEKPLAVMCSYNKINGKYASSNKKLIKDILRGEWNFRGAVISDWGSVNDRVSAIKAGVDLEMPFSSGWLDAEVESALQQGVLSQNDIDECVDRINRLVNSCDSSATAVVDEAYCYDVALKAATESAVLLKNDGVLPLKGRVVVFGRLAEIPSFFGGGSSAVKPKFITNALSGFNECDFDFEYCCDYGGDELAYALQLGQGSDCCVVFVGGEDEGEGFDRQTLDIGCDELRLITALKSSGAKVAVVLCSGSVLNVGFNENVNALVWAGFNGGAGGIAIARLLTGKENFSGKLAETWAAEPDYPCSENFTKHYRQNIYAESIYNGYRWFDKADKKPYFPFGHGLSYTNFEYSDMVVKKTGDYDFEVSLWVKNTGVREGAEVVQLYVANEFENEFLPLKQLKGFEKVLLKAGEKKAVSFGLNMRSFAYYNDMCATYSVRSGEYILQAGSSSRDIRLAFKAALRGSDAPLRSGLVYDSAVRVPAKQDFEKLLGGEIQGESAPKKGEFTFNSTIEEMSGTFIGKIIKKKILKSFAQLPEAERKMNIASALGSPISTAARMSEGLITKDKMEGIVLLANGKIFKGLKKWILKTK